MAVKVKKRPAKPKDNPVDARVGAVIETAVDGMILIDPAGTVRQYNRAAERMFGYSADEVVGRNVKMLMPAPFRDQHDSYLEAYRTTGQRRIIGIGREVAGLHKSGTVFPMELAVSEAGEGESRIFVGIVRDLTRRKQVEAAIREREARLKSIVEIVPDGMIGIDDRGIVQFINPIATRLFGYAAEEVVGRNVSMLMPSPYREGHDGYIERYLRTGERRIIGIGRIVVGLRKDGSTFPMELTVGESLSDSRQLFIGFVRDITERQANERRLQELQAELHHVARLSAMGAMSSALAHELNQPLAAIMNYLQAARRTVAAKGPAGLDVVTGFLEKAGAQVARAGDIIKHLREFIEKGKTERTRELPSKLVDEACALALIGAGALGVRVTYAVASELPSVLVDKIQIQQVITNLVRNAVEAMAKAPRRELQISAVDRGTMVEIAVADSGPGIPDGVRAKLFQPFVTTKAGGMGIGLSICLSIVEAHGGRLWADPGADGGTVFRFTMPVAPAHGRTL